MLSRTKNQSENHRTEVRSNYSVEKKIWLWWLVLIILDLTGKKLKNECLHLGSKEILNHHSHIDGIGFRKRFTAVFVMNLLRRGSESEFHTAKWFFAAKSDDFLQQNPLKNLEKGRYTLAWNFINDYNVQFNQSEMTNGNQYDSNNNLIVPRDHNWYYSHF